MAWSIAEVARMANTTSRTLRHYHDIGLLEPACIGDNGYRYYEREQILRLQRILLLRELGLGLPIIARILAGQQDAATALREHLRQLRRERARLLRVQRTVERTLADIEGDDTMPVEQYFEGFDPRQQERYEQELVDRFGDDARAAIEESHERTAGWCEGDYSAAMTDFHERLRQIAGLKHQGLPHDAEEIQELVAGHHEWLSKFWIADRESYAGLGELYAGDERFRDQIEAVAPGLAGYLRDAMAVYAQRELV